MSSLWKNEVNGVVQAESNDNDWSDMIKVDANSNGEIWNIAAEDQDERKFKALTVDAHPSANILESKIL